MTKKIIAIDGIKSQLRKIKAPEQANNRGLLVTILRIGGAVLLATAGAIISIRTAMDAYSYLSHFIYKAMHGYLADNNFISWIMEGSVVGMFVAQALFAVLCLMLAKSLLYWRWPPKRERRVLIILFSGFILYAISFLTFAVAYGYGMKDF